MGTSTHVTKVVAFADRPEAVLDYLVRRTAETIGRRVDRSALVVVGHVTDVEVTRAGRLDVDVARLAVERSLGSPIPASVLTLAHPRVATGTAPAQAQATLSACTRGVFFLQQFAGDRSVTDAVPRPAFRLGAADHDIVGQDDEALRDETADAVEWYTGLAGEEEARQKALIEALRASNPQIVRAGTRALAESGRREAAAALEARLADADADLRDRIMVAFWLLGRRNRAMELLESAYAGQGKDAWLARWGLAHSVDAEGRREPVLFGPDSSELKGD